MQRNGTCRLTAAFSANANSRLLTNRAAGGTASTLLAVAVFSLVRTAPVAAQSLTNGNFEGGNTGGVGTGWTSYTRTATGANSIITDGTSCQQIQVNTANQAAGVLQTVSGFTSGVSYAIAGRYRTNSTSATVTVKCDTNGGTTFASAEATVATSNSASFVNFGGVVTATGTSMTIFLDIAVTTVSKAGVFDDVTITQLPLLLNGGFEGTFTSGVGASWTPYTVPTTTGAWTSQTAGVPQGVTYQQIQTLTSNSGSAGVYQTFGGCTSGVVYTITGFFRTNSVSATASVKCDTDGGTSLAAAEATVASTTSTTFIPFSGTVTATGTSMTIFLDCKDTTTTHAAAFDGIRIVPTPLVLTNGNFEGGSSSGVGNSWNIYYRTVAGVNAIITDASSFAQQIQITTASQAAGVLQTVGGNTVGAVYRITGRYRTNSTSATVTVKCDTNGGTDFTTAEQTVATTTSNSMSNFSGDVKATGTLMTVFLDAAVNASGANNAGAFDDLAIAAVPYATNVTSSLANGSYKAGQVVPIQVTFSESVTVTGTPTLTLSTGSPATTAVSYTSGSPGTTLTFNYTVAAGNTSSDLDYSSTSALALAGGTINATTGGLAANLTLPAPGAAGSLGSNKAIVIDTTAPTCTISTPSPTSRCGNGTIDYPVTYADSGSGLASVNLLAANVTVNTLNGSATGTVTILNGTTATPTVRIAATGNGILNITIAASRATDTAGNSDAGATAGTSAAIGFYVGSAFSENVGIGAGTTAIASYTGWQNNGSLTFTGSGDVRNTTASSGYTGASGGGNVFITNTVGINFQISSINTTGFTALQLSFGIFKSTTASNGSELVVEVSSDGSTYTPLTVPALPTGGGTAVWALRTATGTIPATSNLRIRFRQTSGTPQFRIDDVSLIGDLSSASIAASGPTTLCTGGSVILVASPGTSWLWTPGTGLSSTTAQAPTASPSSTQTYTVTVTDAYGCTSTANQTVTVTPNFSVGTVTGGGGTLCSPANPGNMTYDGGSGGGALSYQWYSVVGAGAPTLSDTLIGGANASSYDPPSGLTQTTTYNVYVTPTCGTPAFSTTPVTVTVTPTLSVGSVTGGGGTICSGDDPGNMTYGGGSGGGSLSYQWYSVVGAGAPTLSDTLIGGANASSYDPPSGLTQTTTYNVYVTPTCGTPAFSTTPITVTVIPTFSVGTVSGGGGTICSPADPGNMTYGGGSGGGSLSYQWYSVVGAGAPTLSDTLIGGANASSYDPPSGLTQTTTYNVYVTPTCGTPAFSTTPVTVTVDPIDAPTAICQNVSVPLSAGSVSVTATSVDNASTPGANCSQAITTYEIAKGNHIGDCASASFTSSVSFDCSELGPNMVTLRVTQTDGQTSCCTASVTVTNDDPVITQGAGPLSLSVATGSTCPGASNEVALAATDANGDTLAWTVSGPPSAGSASITGSPGNSVTVCYAPSGGPGSDSFTVQVADGCGGFDTITINVTIANAPTLTSAKTIRTHGPSTELAIETIGGGMSEPRRNGIQKLRFTFSQTVECATHAGVPNSGDISASAVPSMAVPAPASIAFVGGGDSGTQLDVTYNPGDLLDLHAYTFSLAGKFKSQPPAGLVLGGTPSVTVRGMEGDVTFNGMVTNVGDVAQTKDNNGKKLQNATLNDSTCQYDVNTDGSVNLIDVAYVKTKLTP